MTFRSNNTKAAIISAQGKLTAVGVGEAIISVFDADFNSVRIIVHVVPFEDTSVTTAAETVTTAESVTPAPETTTEPVTTTTEPENEVRTGDANGDNSIDLKDVMMMRRALAGWDVTVDEAAADINKDGSFDLKDVVLLRRYLAGGFNISLN